MTEKAQTLKLDVQTLEYIRDLMREDAKIYARLSDKHERNKNFAKADKYENMRTAMQIFEVAILNTKIREQQEAE